MLGFSNCADDVLDNFCPEQHWSSLSCKIVINRGVILFDRLKKTTNQFRSHQACIYHPKALLFVEEKMDLLLSSMQFELR